MHYCIKCVCVGVLVICVHVFTVFVLFHLFIFICFVCTSVGTTTTE